MGDGRHRARRHERVRAHVRPEAVGARVRPAAHPGPRCRRTKQDSYTLHQWWFGTPPPTENNYAIIKGNVELLLTGLQLAGPKLTPETFRDGMYHDRRRRRPDRTASTRSSRYGEHGFWDGTDPAASTTRASSTGTRRRRARTRPAPSARACTGSSTAASGTCPASGRPTPVKLFDPAGTVTIYDDGDIPPRAASRSRRIRYAAGRARRRSQRRQTLSRRGRR